MDKAGLADEPEADRAGVLAHIFAALPVCALVATVIVIAVAQRLLNAEAKRAPAGYQFTFVAHPTCPECRDIRQALAGNPNVRMLDWSNSADRAAAPSSSSRPRIPWQTTRLRGPSDVGSIGQPCKRKEGGVPRVEWSTRHHDRACGPRAMAQTLDRQPPHPAGSGGVGHRVGGFAVGLSRTGHRFGRRIVRGGKQARARVCRVPGPELALTTVVSGLGILASALLVCLWASAQTKRLSGSRAR